MELRKVAALKWRNLLSTPEGIEVMLWLRENAPKIPAADATTVVYHAGRNQGYVECLNDIYEIAKADDKNKAGDEALLNKGLD